MSRSGYSEDCENVQLWRAAVERSLYGKRGQAFLRELVAALDALPERKLVAEELVTPSGEVCAMGAVAVARGLDVSMVDYDDPLDVARCLGISRAMAAEISYENDESHWTYATTTGRPEYISGPQTPEQRWARMRAWAERHLIEWTEVPS